MIFKKNYESIYADVKICPESDFDKKGSCDYLTAFARPGRRIKSHSGIKRIVNRKAV